MRQPPRVLGVDQDLRHRRRQRLAVHPAIALDIHLRHCVMGSSFSPRVHQPRVRRPTIAAQLVCIQACRAYQGTAGRQAHGGGIDDQLVPGGMARGCEVVRQLPGNSHEG